MAKERLSKLQKWILGTCLEKMHILKRDAREFYGKRYPPGKRIREGFYGGMTHKYADEHLEKKWESESGLISSYVVKEEYISTKSQEITIYKSFKNLEKKGLLNRGHLTEKGFLTAKSFANVGTFANYKGYKQAIDEELAEAKKRAEQSRKRLRRMLKGPTEEEKKKIAEYETKFKEYESKFNIKTISELCCEECLDKIVKLQKDSGVEKVKALQQEVEGLL